MRRHWFALLSFLVVLALAAGGYYLMHTWIWPYSTRYNANAKLSTTPNGTTDTSTPGQSVPASSQVARSVLLVPLTATATVSADFAAPVSFRVDIVDGNGQVVQGAAETVTLSSSSGSGQFDSGVAALLPDGLQSRIIKYKDTVATKSTIGAFVSGLTGSSLVVVTVAGPPSRLSEIAPAVGHPRSGVQISYGVVAEDALGNVVNSGDVTWKVAGQNGSSTTSITVNASVDPTGHSYMKYTAEQSDVGGTYVVEARLGSDVRHLTINPTN